MSFRIDQGVTPLFKLLVPQGPVFEEEESPDMMNKKLKSLMTALSKLLKLTINSFDQKRFREFDANPGDMGCQARALLLSRLVFQQAIREEVEDLKECRGRLLTAKKGVLEVRRKEGKR